MLVLLQLLEGAILKVTGTQTGGPAGRRGVTGGSRTATIRRPTPSRYQAVGPVMPPPTNSGSTSAVTHRLAATAVPGEAPGIRQRFSVSLHAGNRCDEVGNALCDGRAAVSGSLCSPSTVALFRDAGQDRTLQIPSGDCQLILARYVVPSSNHDSPFDDRRGPNRPADGERRLCPSCGEVMRFLEWYEVTHDRETVTLPAWVCSCGNETFVRPGPFYGRTGSEAPGRLPSRSEDPRR